MAVGPVTYPRWQTGSTPVRLPGGVSCEVGPAWPGSFFLLVVSPIGSRGAEVGGEAGDGPAGSGHHRPSRGHRGTRGGVLLPPGAAATPKEERDRGDERRQGRSRGAAGDGRWRFRPPPAKWNTPARSGKDGASVQRANGAGEERGCRGWRQQRARPAAAVQWRGGHRASGDKLRD